MSEVLAAPVATPFMPSSGVDFTAGSPSYADMAPPSPEMFVSDYSIPSLISVETGIFSPLSKSTIK